MGCIDPPPEIREKNLAYTCGDAVLDHITPTFPTVTICVRYSTVSTDEEGAVLAAATESAVSVIAAATESAVSVTAAKTTVSVVATEPVVLVPASDLASLMAAASLESDCERAR